MLLKVSPRVSRVPSRVIRVGASEKASIRRECRMVLCLSRSILAQASLRKAVVKAHQIEGKHSGDFLVIESRGRSSGRIRRMVVRLLSILRTAHVSWEWLFRVFDLLTRMQLSSAPNSSSAQTSKGSTSLAWSCAVSKRWTLEVIYPELPLHSLMAHH